MEKLEYRWTVNRYQRLCRYCVSIKGAVLVGLPFPRKCEKCECWKTDVAVSDTQPKGYVVARARGVKA